MRTVCIYAVERFIMIIVFQVKGHSVRSLLSRFSVYHCHCCSTSGGHRGKQMSHACVSGPAIELRSEVASTSSSPLSQPRRRHRVTGPVRRHDVRAASSVFGQVFH